MSGDAERPKMATLLSTRPRERAAASPSEASLSLSKLFKPTATRFGTSGVGGACWDRCCCCCCCSRRRLHRELAERAHERLHVGGDVGGHAHELVGRVEHLDGLRVRVVAHVERAVAGGGELAHLARGVGERLGDEVRRLVLGDRILGGGGDVRVERQHLGLVAHAVLELAERRQEAGAVRLERAALAAHAKLDGEPVARGELLDERVARAE
mmetsp:Transcript_41835/g.102958  ORF Transcript_41835/g.102958 Transcript_41835/m.102958 type:complete len:212 (-) Transcript_41835:949-1584(-)